MIKKLSQLIDAAKEQKTMTLVVAAADDDDVLQAVVKAAEEDIITPILVGDVDSIKAAAARAKVSIDGYEIVPGNTLEEIAKTSVALVSEGRADFLMKGLIDTSILLKAVLNKDYGLRTDSLLSHVMLYDVPSYHKLVCLTDGGMNIAPDLEAKKKIIDNAATVVQSLGTEKVNVACIAAKEKVNPKMPATVDAKALEEKCTRGEFADGVVVEGPLAMDLAFSKEAAEVKKFASEIAGDTDIILAPNIEVGNGIGKTLTYLAGATSAGIVMGAKVPIVLVSRADDYETKLNSIALGSVIAGCK